MVQQVLRRAACHGVLPIDGIVPQLVYERIGLVGYAFAVAVDVDAEGRSCLDGVLAQLPHGVEHRVVGGELRRIVIERIYGRATNGTLHGDIVAALDLAVAERGYFAEVIGCGHGLRTRIARIGSRNHPIGAGALAEDERITVISDRTRRPGVDTGLFRGLADRDMDRVAALGRLQRQLQGAERNPPEIDEYGRRIESPHFARLVALADLHAVRWGVV